MKLRRFLDDEISLGKGSVKIPATEMIQKYRDRYNIMKARGLRFKFTIHYVLPGGRTIVHIKVPSETVRNFFYDVVLELSLAGGAKKFEDCHIRVFSNCPSFVYTYAYVFYHLSDDELGKQSMMVDDFKQKIPKNCIMIQDIAEKVGETPLTQRPVIRNPYGLPLFDKSIYYAIFYILENFDFNRTMYNKHISSIPSIMKEIEDFDTLMIHRKSAAQKDRDRERAERKQTKKTMQQAEREHEKQSGIQRIRPIVKRAKIAAVKKTESAGVHKITGKPRRK